MKNRFFKLILICAAVLFALAGCAVGPRAESTPGLAANDSHLFVSAANMVYKIDLLNGIEVWRYPTEKNVRMMTYAPVLLNDETFLFGDMYNTLHKLNIENANQVLWQFKEAKGWYQSKVAEKNDVVIAPNTDRNVYAINSKDGTLLWKHEDTFAFIAEPLIIDDLVIISSQDHEILWLDLNTGEEVYEPFPMNGAVVSKPLFIEETGLIYIGSLGDEFVAIDPKTQKEIWRYEGTIDELSSIWATPIYLDGQLIFNDDLGNVISVDPLTGKENWTLASLGKMLAGLAALGDDKFLVASENGEISVYDLERRPVRQFQIEKAKIYTTPLVTDNLIIISPVGAPALIYSYGFELSGMPTWTYKPGK